MEIKIELFFNHLFHFILGILMRALNHAMGELIYNHSLAISSHEEVQIISMKGEILFNELLFYLQIVLVDELERTRLSMKNRV